MLVAEGAKAPSLVPAAASVRGLRILVVDDHEVIRSGLRWLLTRMPWVDRCVIAGGAAEALALVRSLTFDLALVDVDLGAECGLAACERLSATGVRTVLLTSRWDLVSLRTARAAGARGAIDKDSPARSLLAAVHAVARGGTCESAAARADEVRFAPRERAILRLVGAGLTNAEIGAALYLAPGTIKHHMLELYEKLGAPNRAAAVHSARRLGMLADPCCEATAPGAVEPARVLVADACDVRRTGLLLALHQRPWVAACVGARSERDALAALGRFAPDVAIVEPALEAALARPGLRTVLLRDADLDHVADHAAQPAAAPADGPGRAGTVSARERDVLVALAAGATNPAIARDLGLSPNTVKQHASSIFRKLGVRNRAEAVRRADELGLLAA